MMAWLRRATFTPFVVYRVLLGGGLLALAKNCGVELEFFTPDELNKIEVPNPSHAVKRHIGASSICEAAAILAAQNGRLIMEKQKSQNATIAVALAGSI